MGSQGELTLSRVGREVLAFLGLEEMARSAKRSLRRYWPGRTCSLLIPVPWFTGGPTPKFYASARKLRGLPTVRIYPFVDSATRLEDREVLLEIPFRHTADPGILRADCPRKLALGDYNVSVHSADGNPRPLWYSAFRVRSSVDYDEQALEQLKTRRPARGVEHHVRFSIATTVWNTAPSLLEELYRDLQSQTYRNFEWLLLDNGSTRASTVECVADLARRSPWVRLFRVEENIHIVPGNRYLLDRADGDYIVPVDSDDALYADSLAFFASAVEKGPSGLTPLLYSNEHKIAPDRHPIELLWRPSWSRLFAQSTCPSAHLMAFRRDLALEVGVYGSDYAKGCHDWDTALRFSDAGHLPKRVSEVLYGWRIHSGSTAGSEDAKDYIRESQRENLRRMLVRNRLESKFEVKPLEQLGYYHLERLRHDARPIEILVVPSPGFSVAEAVRDLVQRTRYPSWRITAFTFGEAPPASGGDVDVRVIPIEKPGDLIPAVDEAIRNSEGITGIVGAHLRASDPDWLWDASGTLELDSTTAMTGGQILSPEGKVLHLGYVGGMNGLFGTPFRLKEPSAVVSPLRVRRHVSSVYGSFVVFRPELVGRAGGISGIDTITGFFGVDLSLRLRRHGYKVGWTPTMAAQSLIPLQDLARTADGICLTILAEGMDLIEDDPYYHRALSLDPDRYGELCSKRRIS